MMFTSSMRRMGDGGEGNTAATAAVSKTASETARLLARKRSHLIRRHTCSVLTPGSGLLGDEVVDGLDNLSRVLPSTTLHQVSFMDPESDRVIMVDTTTLINAAPQHHLAVHRRSSSRRHQRCSVGNVIKYVTVCGNKSDK